MNPRVLQRSHHLGRDHVARDPNDEQLAEAGVEDQLRRYPGIAAPTDSRVRLLTLREGGEDLLLNGREPRFATDETLVAGNQTRKCLLGRVLRRRVQAHRRCGRRVRRDVIGTSSFRVHLSPAARPRWRQHRSSSSASSPRRHVSPQRHLPQARPSAYAE